MGLPWGTKHAFPPIIDGGKCVILRQFWSQNIIYLVILFEALGTLHFDSAKNESMFVNCGSDVPVNIEVFPVHLFHAAQKWEWKSLGTLKMTTLSKIIQVLQSMRCLLPKNCDWMCPTKVDLAQIVGVLVLLVIKVGDFSNKSVLYQAPSLFRAKVSKQLGMFGKYHWMFPLRKFSKRKYFVGFVNKVKTRVLPNVWLSFQVETSINQFHFVGTLISHDYLKITMLRRYKSSIDGPFSIAKCKKSPAHRRESGIPIFALGFQKYSIIEMSRYMYIYISCTYLDIYIYVYTYIYIYYIHMYRNYHVLLVVKPGGHPSMKYCSSTAST